MIDYGVIHSYFSSIRFKQSIERMYPAFFTRYFRLAYNAFAVLSLLPVLALVYLLPDTPLYIIPYPLIIVTLTIQAGAALAAIYSLQATSMTEFLGLRQFVNPTSTSGKLVTSGLYQYVRHPLYTLAFIIILLFPWMTANSLAFFISSSIYLVIGAFFEERKMLQEFGEEYAHYKARTPMFFPRLSKFLGR